MEREQQQEQEEILISSEVNMEGESGHSQQENLQSFHKRMGGVKQNLASQINTTSPNQRQADEQNEQREEEYDPYQQSRTGGKSQRDQPRYKDQNPSENQNLESDPRFASNQDLKKFTRNPNTEVQKSKKKIKDLNQLDDDTRNSKQSKVNRAGSNKKKRTKQEREKEDYILDDNGVTQPDDKKEEMSPGTLQFYQRNEKEDEEDEDDDGIKEGVEENREEVARIKAMRVNKILMKKKEKLKKKASMHEEFEKEDESMQKSAKGQNSAVHQQMYGLQDVKVNQIKEKNQKSSRPTSTRKIGGSPRKKEGISSRNENDIESGNGKQLHNTELEDYNEKTAENDQYIDQKSLSKRSFYNKTIDAAVSMKEVNYKEQEEKLRQLQMQMNANQDEDFDRSYVSSNDNQRILESHFKSDNQKKNDRNSIQKLVDYTHKELNLRNQKKKSEDDDQFERDPEFEQQSQRHAPTIEQLKNEQVEQNATRLKLNLQAMNFENNQRNFRREHFKQLIKNTYDEYFQERSMKKKWDINEFLDVVDKQQLDKHLAPYLESNDTNAITLTNMPKLDLGDKPVTHFNRNSESQQNYIFPKSIYPEKIVFRQQEYKPEFRKNRLTIKYEAAGLMHKDITLQEFENAVKQADEYIKPFRSKVTNLNKCNIINMLVALVVCIIISMIVGMTSHWAFSIIFIFVFFVFVFVQYKVLKLKMNKPIRQTHFMLALFCRSENNRFFLKKHIEMRPGYLGKWLEFVIHDPEEKNLEQILDRRWQRIQQNLAPPMKKQEDEDRALALALQEEEDIQESDHHDYVKDVENHLKKDKKKGKGKKKDIDDEIYKGQIGKQSKIFRPEEEDKDEEEKDDFGSPDTMLVYGGIDVQQNQSPNQQSFKIQNVAQPIEKIQPKSKQNNNDQSPELFNDVQLNKDDETYQNLRNSVSYDHVDA